MHFPLRGGVSVTKQLWWKTWGWFEHQVEFENRQLWTFQQRRNYFKRISVTVTQTRCFELERLVASQHLKSVGSCFMLDVSTADFSCEPSEVQRSAAVLPGSWGPEDWGKLVQSKVGLWFSHYLLEFQLRELRAMRMLLVFHLVPLFLEAWPHCLLGREVIWSHLAPATSTRLYQYQRKEKASIWVTENVPQTPWMRYESWNWDLR